ncbi:DUF2567 domain-containing protein [Nocardia sp. NPDC005978]|uniref:DUF2567 domain-containing protein n=1 Tax=unclassified Nocardia TaxID=2637762 RepID=UPI0033A389F0
MATTFTAAGPSADSSAMLAREVRAAAVVFGALVVVSGLAGVLWAYLAPAEELWVIEPDRGAALTGESLHRFDSVAIFVLLGLATAFLSTAAAWRWRRVRGPILLLGLLGGSLAGAVVMRLVGEALAEARHPRPDNPAVHTIVEFAPTVEGWPALIVQPLVTVLVVLFLAALSTSDDLGSGLELPFVHPRPEPNILAPGAFGSDISYGPYGTPGVQLGNAQGPGPRDPVVPFETPDRNDPR